ncbi:MAG: DUF3151 domain-containing protein [Candidatus Dormibacteria bacterium]
MPEPPPPPRPLTGVPMAAHGHQVESGHVTILPDEPEEARQALAELMGGTEGPAPVQLERSLGAVCGRYPSFLDGWARLAQAAYQLEDPVAAYAYSRVGYHRGLDRLRRHGWGGTGQVRWGDRGNRGFLRSLQMLMVAAAALGEMDEAERCRQFLLDLDPEDGLQIANRPPLVAGERIAPSLLG